MSSYPAPPAPSVGRFTAFILGLVVFVCVTMIVGTSYLKYQLDHTQTLLAAPDNAVNGDQDSISRLRRDWGYGGFLGHAQSYAATHDASGLNDMKAEIKSADDIIAHLPDRTPAETRHELAAIAATFDTTMQKIAIPPGGAGEFTAADLTPLYAALPVLDSHIASLNAEGKLAAQSKMQFWSMLLTLVCWCSLIIASACAAGIFLVLRDKRSAPMRALAQSIQNMARGDMRTAIWGIERQDMIGELARAVDVARYHFSHLPDLSLLSDQGPVRLRFEGGSRSLFDAMMKAISRDSEIIRSQSVSLSETVTKQQENINALSAKVDDVLHNILQRGQTGDTEIRRAIADMSGSAEVLRNAHLHAADQLNRLLPHIQERAAGLAEITHITGKQISNTLQSLSTSEYGLRMNAEQVKETLKRITSTADDLGERLFGAINLLQAGGKVLTETGEALQAKLGTPQEAQALSLAPIEEKLATITAQLASLRGHIDQAVATPPPTFSSAPTSVSDPTLLAVLAELQNKIVAMGASTTSDSDVNTKLTTIEQNLSATQRAVESIERNANLLTTIHEMPMQEPKPGSASPQEFQKLVIDQWFQMSAQLEATRTGIIAAMSEQIDRIENRIGAQDSSPLSRTASDYSTQRQIEQQTQILSELVATLGILDAHMQQIKSEIHATGA